MWVVQAILLSLLACLLVHLRKSFQSQKSYPPGPLWVPFIGSVWRLRFKVSKDSFIELAKIYGNIYTLWIGSKPVVVLSGFQAVKEGLINHAEHFAERCETPYIKAFTNGKGIIYSNGHNWKQQRKFGVVTLRKLGLGKKGMEQQIEEEALQLAETFAHSKGQPIDPALFIRNSVANVICAAVFGFRFSVEDQDFLQMLEAIQFVLTFSASFVYGLYELFPRLMDLLPGPHKKSFLYREAVLSFAKKVIEKHREHQALHDPQDYIDFYLLQMEKSVKDPNSTYNEENLAQCILELLMAGSDTTSTTLQWALLLMVNHPDIQEKVHKEIEDVLGSSQSFSYQHVKKLPYTNAVIHEIQRTQYILLFGVSRQCAKDVNMFGYFIPKGTYIVPDLHSVLQDPELWEASEVFNPNRFLDKDGKFMKREAFLPFGTGSRSCLGQQLAEIELFIFFTSLMRAFKFQLPEGVKELSKKPIIGVTTPPSPYELCAVPRCSAS